MRYSLITIIITSLFFSCKAKYIDKSKMAKILLDMYIADNYTTVISTSQDYKSKLMRNADSLNLFYSNIFSHYQTTASEFQSSYKYYAQHPTQLDGILTDMQNQANLLQKKNGVKEQEK